MSILVVEKGDTALEGAVMIRDRLYAYRSTAGSGIREGAVYAGVVDRALKNVSAVFVRLPGKEFGFLPVPAGQKPPPSGARVTVQVRRPPSPSKKAMLTRDIALADAHLVYLPCGAGVHVSARIESEEERAALRQTGDRLLPDHGGLILRSSALAVDPETLKGERDRLLARWRQIEAAHQAAPALLWDGDGLPDQLMDEESERLERIVTNAPELFADAPCPVSFSEQPFALYSVRHRLETALRRTVRMKSGATLVIDPCEAMTVIDVNSALAAGGRDIRETAEKINVEAAWEIARLLRLRGIGGMIVVDFIDMDTQAARERVLAAMREALREDPVKTTVHAFTALGLLELTRRREQVPLAPLPDLPCPRCGGTGIYFADIKEDASDA